MDSKLLDEPLEEAVERSASMEAVEATPTGSNFSRCVGCSPPPSAANQDDDREASASDTTSPCKNERLENHLGNEQSNIGNQATITDSVAKQETSTPKQADDGDSFKSPSIAPLRRVNRQKTQNEISSEITTENHGEPMNENPPTVTDENSDTANLTSKELSEKMVQKPKERVSNTRSPAEQLKHQQIPVPYKEPVWGSVCPHAYSFEVIKNGTVIDNFDLASKSYYVIGRLPNCDMVMEHPSLSRYHAVVQYCGVPNERHEQGWYLYDLNSTHGTWVNKEKVKPQIYTRLRVGYVVKLGGSTRLNILQGPDGDQDKESELTVTELKEQKQRKKLEAEILENVEDETVGSQSDDGCSWGMDTSEPEEIDSVNPFALEAEPQNEELYIDDPKKALRGFFEREGCDLPEYQVVEDGFGKFKCCVELPIDNALGDPIIAEVSVSGKKKEAVAACALEACRILDRHGELRKATHESRAKKRKNWEEDDFYASDDDTFLDRTGDIEKKRKQRMKRESKAPQKVETYDSLLGKISDIGREIQEINEKLAQSNAEAEAAVAAAEGLDAFDAYMASLKSGALDTKTKTQLKRKLFGLKQEKQKLEKLANTAKPALPKFQKYGLS